VFIIQPIDEAYFGKTPDALAIEKVIENIRKKYKITDNTKTIVEDKLIIELDNAIEKAFGFKKIYFGFDNVSILNCYTIPIRESSYGRLDDKYTVTKTGIKYKPEVEAKTLIVTTKKLFFNKSLTNAQVLATILHEIGHNFTDAVVPIMLPLDTLKQSLKTVLLAFLSAAKRTVEDLVPSKLGIVSILSNMLSSDSGLSKYLSKKDTLGREYLIDLIGSTDKRRYIDEKFADQFATMYGYGPELASVLVKIEYNQNNIKNEDFTNLMNTLYGIVDLSMDVMFQYDYPMLAARLKSSVVILERELDTNDSLPPELKKELESQIKDINLLAMQYSNLDKSSNYSIAKKTYFSYVYKCLQNGDLFSKFISDTYNLDKIDKNLEANKK